MAAIDKIYLSTYDQYIQFRNWLMEQPKLKDKYGKEVSLMKYFFDYWDKKYWFDENGKDVTHPVYSAPYYVDAYIIRNCPFDFVQEELMLNYGYWSQGRIRRFYEDIKNWDASKGECPYWAKLEDFIFNEDGTMTIKGLDKSSYEEILEGKLYTAPYRENVKRGTHFKLVKSPYSYKGIPFERPIRGPWCVEVDMGYDFLMFNQQDLSNNNGTWDFMDEFVETGYSISAIHLRTITAVKRHIRKWNLPVGAKVIVQGDYIDERYEFIVTK